MALSAEEKRRIAAERRRERILAQASSRSQMVIGDKIAPGLDMQSAAQPSSAERARIENLQIGQPLSHGTSQNKSQKQQPSTPMPSTGSFMKI